MKPTFFCQACLTDKTEVEKSPDDRYCQDCYELLLREAEMLTSHQRADWRPKITTATLELKAKAAAPTPQVGGGIMSTLADKKSEVDIITPADASRTMARGKRGPKHKPLPEDLIMQWASKGMSSKAIAARLKSELGIETSYKTIQRRLHCIMQ